MPLDAVDRRQFQHVRGLNQEFRRCQRSDVRPLTPKQHFTAGGGARWWSAILDAHVAEPSLAVVEIAAADDATVFTLQMRANRVLAAARRIRTSLRTCCPGTPSPGPGCGPCGGSDPPPW
ncbi:DUF6207 family protein [Streptomyces sp. NPDC005813]|uniref:DUF6207 family protein n=1 Tax=Streptomyces sp. NPDC005813 TaxID=3155592 RepID=UPI0033F1C347